MGTDIHGVIEKRVASGVLGDKWVGVRTLHHITPTEPSRHGQWFAMPLSTARNYERFAALAGVRGPGPYPRGLPPDASETTRVIAAEDGGHTPSWLPLYEATAIFINTEHNGPPTSKDPTMAAYDYFGIEAEDLTDYRLVFWFDS